MSRNDTTTTYSVVALQEGEHIEVQARSQLPFRYLGQLGRGASATVETIEDQTTGRKFAHKFFGRISAGNIQNFKKQFRNEIEIIKRLQSHSHVINVFASYACGRELGILLLPVADGGDLAAYLQDIKDTGTAVSPTSRVILNCAFGCLASGLAFIHEQTIRHKDIKPSNILLHRNQVIYTDFGISFAAEQDDTTTTGFAGPRTNRYCAPEVANARPRNRKSDIFSLGCVYLEILTVLRPESLLWVPEDCIYWQKVALYPDYFHFHHSADPALIICEAMLSADNYERISAADLLAYFRDLQNDRRYYGRKFLCDECASGGKTASLRPSWDERKTMTDSRSPNQNDRVDDTTISDSYVFEISARIAQSLKQVNCFYTRQEAIRQVARGPLSPLENRPGRVRPYILVLPITGFDYIMIGITDNQSVQCSFWSQHYRSNFVLYGVAEQRRELRIFDLSLPAIYGNRWRDLILAQLCEAAFEDRDCLTCHNVHKGWLRVSPEYAARVIKKFYNFSSSQPYVERKTERGWWDLGNHAKLTQLDELCEPWSYEPL